LHEKELTLVKEPVKETVIIKGKPGIWLVFLLVILSVAVV
jgi:hypothetical protein